jgi:hypothetical protein
MFPLPGIRFAMYFGRRNTMYTLTIFNYAGKPIIHLSEVSPLAANQWHGVAREYGYYCRLKYVGGTDESKNHRVACDQDIKQYSMV